MFQYGTTIKLQFKENVSKPGRKVYISKLEIYPFIYARWNKLANNYTFRVSYYKLMKIIAKATLIFPFHFVVVFVVFLGRGRRNKVSLFEILIFFPLMQVKTTFLN